MQHHEPDQRSNLYPLTTAAEQRSDDNGESFTPYLWVALAIAAACIIVIGIIVVISEQPARRTTEHVGATR